MPEQTQEQKAQSNDGAIPSDDQLQVLHATIAGLKSTNERLLNESKDHAGKYRTLRDEVSTKEKADLEQNEQWKELLDKEKNSHFELGEKYKGLRKQTLQKSLEFEIAGLAKDAFDVRDVINSMPLDEVNIDEDNLTFGGLEEAVKKVRESKEYLFKPKDSVKMNQKMPKYDGTPASFDNLNATEKQDAFVRAIQTISKKE